MRKRGFTLIELLVVIAIIGMLLAILAPALSRVRQLAQRLVCGTNIKGLGTAQTVYAHDYDGRYTVQGRGYAHDWGNSTLNWYNPLKDWSNPGSITVGASLYLLVREADVGPASFVCPSSRQTEFDGRTDAMHDLVELWDFGEPGPRDQGPTNTVSYSYHQPYRAGSDTGDQGTGSRGSYAANSNMAGSVAVMADRNPWFDDLSHGGLTAENYMDVVGYFPTGVTDWEDIRREMVLGTNSRPHRREGQNVLYADGSVAWETRPDVGARNDNIYTRQYVEVSEESRRRGAMLNRLDAYPRRSEDSVLVNDISDGDWGGSN